MSIINFLFFVLLSLILCEQCLPVQSATTAISIRTKISSEGERERERERERRAQVSNQSIYLITVPIIAWSRCYSNSLI